MSDVTIPEDVMDAAKRALVLSEWPKLTRAAYELALPVIARAILAERERCAKIAENRDPHWPDDGDRIAQAIRSSHE